MTDDLSRADLSRAESMDLSRARRGTTVYILQCANGQYYVGSTTSLIKRIGEHQQADEALYRGAKFTKAHQPVELVYTEEYEDEHKARMREQQLHGWSRAKKEALIRGDIEELKKLAKKK